MEKPKVTWNDFHSAKPKELMNHYKLTERQLQQNLHKHLDGANRKDKEKIYDNFYGKRK